jgi:hypothetical protein
MFIIGAFEKERESGERGKWNFGARWVSYLAQTRGTGEMTTIAAEAKAPVDAISKEQEVRGC